MADSVFMNNTPETATDLGTLAFEGNSFPGPTTTRVFEFDSVGQGVDFSGSNGGSTPFPFPFTVDVIDTFVFDPFALETVSVNFNADTVGTFSNFLAFLPISGVSKVTGAVVANWYGGLYIDEFPQPEPRNITNAQSFGLWNDLRDGSILPGTDWSEALWVNSGIFAGAEATWVLTGEPVFFEVLGFHYQGVPSQIEAGGFIPEEIDYRFTILPLTGLVDPQPDPDPDPNPDPGPDPDPDPAPDDPVNPLYVVNDVDLAETHVGTAGIDIYYAVGDLEDFTFEFLGNGQIRVTDSFFEDTPDILVGFERVELWDGWLAFDTDGNAGQAYRLYQAAFDRDPDPLGLGFWIDNYDDGSVDLVQMAEFFMQSPEFETKYGAPETLSDDDFLTLHYANVLKRTPDQAGFDFWSDQQDMGLSRAEMLQYFSESTENYNNVAGEIADGIWYL